MINVVRISFLIGLLMCFFEGSIYAQTRDRAQKEKRTERMKDDSETKEISAYMAGMHALLVDGNMDEAISCFRTMLLQDSLHAPSNYQLSLLLNDAEEALTYSRKAAEIDTTNKWYRYQYAQLLGRTNRYKEAIEVCKSALKVQNNDLQTYRYLAALYESDRQPYAALAVLDSALVLFGNDLSLLEAKQEILLNANILDRAKANAELLMSLDAQNSHYPLYMAYTYIRGRDTSALRYLRQAEALDSTDVNTMLAYCDYYQSNGMTGMYLSTLGRVFSSDQIPLSAKINYFNEVLKTRRFYTDYFGYIDNLARTIAIKYPNSPEAGKLYAQHLINIGNTDGALELYKSRLSDSVPDIDVYQHIIGIESYKKNADSVLYYTQKAVQLFPDDYELPLMYAGALLSQKQYNEALKVLKETMKDLTQDSLCSVYLCTIGDVYNEMGKLNQVYKNYEKSLKYNPNNVVTLNNYSYALSVAGEELDKALSMVSVVMNNEPSNPTYIDTYAWILYKMGRYKEAKAAMQKAIAFDMNNSAELFLHYGDILYALSEEFSAVLYWKKALAAGADKKEVEERLQKVEQ